VWTQAADAASRVSDTEAVVIGLSTRDGIDAWVADALESSLGERVHRVLFRSGRIDVVYGLATETGRRVLLKVHRQPVVLDARLLVVRAQHLLAGTGFPCARPLAGPLTVGDRVVSVESLLPEGEKADRHDPRIRRAIAEGLAQQVAVLSAHPDLVAQVGPPPAWCDHRQGAWGRTHDPFFDFRTTPAEYAWLQEFAQDASDVLTRIRYERAPVAAHGDWYCGNLRFHGERLVAAYDWDLIADQEAVVAGIAAAAFTGESETAGLPTPQEAAGFLLDYEQARQIRFTTVERTAAAAAMRWNLAYSARCDVTNAQGSPPSPQLALELLRTRRSEYFALAW
jgi:Phosphotransferase enzyme family